ncbi:hypothetical protein [Microbacterium lacticum]
MPPSWTSPASAASQSTVGSAAAGLPDALGAVLPAAHPAKTIAAALSRATAPSAFALRVLM